MAIDFPTVKAQIAFADNPLVASPTWVDVSTDDRQIEINRTGRSNAQGSFDAGTVSIRLDNSGREYDPTNTASPYYPNVLPMRQVRVIADYEGTNNIPLFRGFIESWPPEVLGADNSEVTISGSDAFTVLATLGLDGATFGFDYTGQRFLDVMDEISWPAALRVYRITADQHRVTDAEEVEESALEHLQMLAESEMGELFVNAAGAVVFHDRHWHIELASSGHIASWGDDVTVELPYVGLQPSYDASQIINHSVVWLPEWDEGEFEDATSQTKYLKRTASLNTQLYEPSDADNLAQALVWRFKEPRLRFESMEVKPAYTPQIGTALWYTVLHTEIGQHVLVKHRPPGGGPVISQPCFISSIQHRIGPGKQWSSTFGLEVPDPVTAFMVLDHATYGGLEDFPLSY